MTQRGDRGPRIGFAGMSHLGINSAVAAAAMGFDVTAYDPDQALIQDLETGEFPIYEEGLVELAAKHRGRISYSSDIDALAATEVCYVARDVPTDDRGESDLTPIVELIDRLQNCLSAEAILVVLSQVPPGFTRSIRRNGAALYYQVETLIFGQAVERALHPERFIIGCAEPEAAMGDAYDAFLRSFGCEILKMRYESAELAKISINMCLVSSISTANTLAELCECIGADWSEIVPALRLDRRIGQYAYLTPGLGIAGGNLERDLATVCGLADRYGTDAGVVDAWLANSRHRRDWAYAVLENTVLQDRPDAHIAVLGLAYKQDTASTKNSPALALLDRIPTCRVTAYDPMVEVDPKWHPNLHRAPNAVAACKDADVLAVMTPWPQFRDLSIQELAAALSGRLVIDPYSVLDEQLCREFGLDYRRLGK